MKVKDVKNFLKQKNIPYKSGLTYITSEYKGIKFRFSSTFIFNGQIDGGCVLEFLFPKPLQIRLNIRAGLNDFSLSYYFRLHKPLYAKKIGGETGKVKYYCIDSEFGELILRETRIPYLVNELAGMLGIKTSEDKSIFSELFETDSSECGFVVTDEVMFLVITDSFQVDIEKLFELAYQISKEFENFSLNFMSMLPKETKTRQKIDKVLKNMIYIIIILLTILFFGVIIFLDMKNP